MSEEKTPDIRDLDITSQATAGAVHAVRDINIDLYRGETVAIVGEPGPGRSVTMRAAMGVLAKNIVINHGNIEFRYCHDNGTAEKMDTLTKDRKWIRRHISGKRIAMIFQDPMILLDPIMQIGRQIMEGMIWYYHTSKKETYWKAVQLLDEVRIEDVEKCMRAYPHQLSGGMRQRVVIVIAFVYNPDLLICDEPTTALDVMIQVKIIEPIHGVQKERGLPVVHITHDLGVVAKVADYVNIMYAGRIVERDKSNEIFYDPRRPCTWGLLSAMPDLGIDDDRLRTISGSLPNLLYEKAGDASVPRNVYALVVDDKLDPPMFQVTDSHCAATWLLDPRVPRVEMPIELKRKIERMKKEAEQYDGEL